MKEALWQTLLGLPYLMVGLMLAFAIGYPVANKIMTPGRSLRDHLFEHDNRPAGLAFGGMMLAVLYASYSAITGPSLASVWMDLGAAALAVVLSSLAIAVSYRIAGVVVGRSNGGDDLNHEIFDQKNWAAASVALVLMLAIVNGLTEENSLGPAPLRDGAIALTVMVCGFLVIPLYRFTHLKGQSFLREFFHDDNPAAGVSLVGFAIASSVILYKVTTAVKLENSSVAVSAQDILLWGIGGMVVLGVLRWLVLTIMNRLLKIDFHDEVFEQNNVGAAFLDVGLVLGLTFLLSGSLI